MCCQPARVHYINKGKKVLDQEDKKRELSVSLLCKKAEEKGSLPTRADFTPEEVNLIKQKLGPWPRALEAAGLKEKVGKSAAEKSREKRERAKKAAKLRKRTEQVESEESADK